MVCAALGGARRELVLLRDDVRPAFERGSLHEHTKAFIGGVGGDGATGCVDGGGARRASLLETPARDRLLAVACCCTFVDIHWLIRRVREPHILVRRLHMDFGGVPGVAGLSYADVDDGGEGGGVVSVLSAPVLVEIKRDSERCRTGMIPSADV